MEYHIVGYLIFFSIFFILCLQNLKKSIKYAILNKKRKELFMSDFICPICNAEYSQKPKICTCGFEGIEYIDYYNPLRYDEGSQNTVFKIYKFSKKE